MADGVVELILKLRDQLSGPARDAAAALGELAQREREEAQARREAERVEMAKGRLEALAAQNSAVEQAVIRYRRLRDEIQGLAKITGDQASADRALAVAKGDLQAALTSTSGGLAKAVAGAEDLDKSTRRAAFGAQQLRYQLADIGTQLVGGINPFVILAQQGPDIAHAFNAGGGAANTMRAAFGGLVSSASAAAPILAAVGVAVSGLATAMLVGVNAFQDGEDALTGVNAAILDNADYSKQSAEEVKRAADSWRDFRGAVESAQNALIILRAGLSSGLAAGARTVEQARADAAPALLAAGQRVARLEREIQAAQEGVYSGAVTGEESLERQRKASEELEKARAELVRLKKERDEGIEAINAFANAEERERVATEEGREAKREHARATRDMAKEDREAAKAARELAEMQQRNTDALLRGMDAFYEQKTAVNAAMSSLLGDVDQLVPPKALDRLTQLQLLLFQLNTEASKSPENMKALSESISRVSGALEKEQKRSVDPMALIDALGGAAGAVGSGGGISAGLGAAGGVAGAAGLAGAAAALGPFAAVFAAVAALGRLVDRLVVTQEEREAGQKTITEKGSESFLKMADQVGDLPDAILGMLQTLDTSALQDAFFAAVHDFSIALINDLPQIIIALVEMVPTLLGTSISGALLEAAPDIIAALIDVFGDPETWREIAQAIVGAVVELGGSRGSNVGNLRNVANVARADSAFFGSPGLQGQVSISGVVGDAREIVRHVRDAIGDLGSGLGLSRDGRFA